MTLKTTARKPNAIPPPPDSLAGEEAALWTSIVSEHVFDAAAPLAILQAALEARGRARACREQINRDGLTVVDRFQQQKPHGLLSAERDNRAAFLSGINMLRLDVAS